MVSKMDTIDIISGSINIVSEIFGIKHDSIDKKQDQNLEIINNNYDVIKENLIEFNRDYDGIREVGSNVDKNLNKLISMFDRKMKIFQLMQKDISNNLFGLRNFVKKSKVEQVVNESTILIEQFIDKNILIPSLEKGNLIIYLESPNGVVWFENFKNILIKNINLMLQTPSDYVIPKDANDEIAFKTIQVLLANLQIYFKINLNLIMFYKFLADHYYDVKDVGRFNDNITKFISTIKSIKIILIDTPSSLIEKVKNLFDMIKKLDYIRLERKDISHFLTEMELKGEDLKIEYQNLEKMIGFNEFKPMISIQLDFSRSNVTTPFAKWENNEKVFYALQYKNNTDLSLVSDWSGPYEIHEKACPFLTLNDSYTGDVERIVFRKFDKNPTSKLVARLKNGQKEFRDIDRDLFDLVTWNLDEELAIKNLNFLVSNGANVNATFDKQKTLMHYTSEKNRPKLLMKLIKNNANIHSIDEDGRQPIHNAAMISKETVQILVDHGADVNVKTNLNWTPIHYAVKAGDEAEEIISFLIEKGSDVTLKTKNNFTIYHIASTSDAGYLIHSDKIKGININAKSNSGLSPLQLAVIGEFTKTTEILLRNNSIDVNAQSEFGFSTLHFVAMLGNLEIVDSLFNYNNTNFNSLSFNRWTPLQLAILSGKEDVALKLLESKDIDVNSEGMNSLTALHLATIKSMIKIVSKLIEKKARVDKRDSNDATSLHFANNADIAYQLVHFGSARMNVRNSIGNTPLMLAENIELVKYYNAKIEVRINDRNNLNHRAIERAAISGNLEKFLILKPKSPISFDTICLAAYANNLEIVKLLLNEFTNFLNEKDKNGDSILHHTVRGKNLDMIKFLFTKKDFNLKEQNNNGDTVLNIAASNDDFLTFRYLISKQQIDLNIQNKNGYTPLLEAGVAGSWTIVELLLEDKRTIITQQTNNSNNILDYACRDNKFEMVKFFLDELKFDVNHLDKNNWAPISWATRYGHLDLSKYLIDEKGANYALLEDKSYFFINHLAVISGNFDLVKYLVGDKRMRMDYSTKTTLLHLGMTNLTIVKYLLENASLIDACDIDGNTPALFGASLKAWDSVAFLISKGTNTELINTQGNTIVHEIAKSSRTDILKLLKDKNRQIIKEKKLKNSQGMTALHISAISRQLNMTKYLVEELGFEFDRDNFGNTPIHYSAINDDLQTTAYLAEKFPEFFDKSNKDQKTACTLTKDLNLARYLIEKKKADHSDNLFQNVDQNSLGVLKYLIEIKNIDPNLIEDEHKRTVLMNSAMKNRLAIVKYLAGDLKMDTDRKDIAGNDASFYADQGNHFEVLSFLDEMDNYLKIKKPKFSSIYESIYNNDSLGVAYYIRFNHVDPNQKISTFDNNSLLHLASMNQNVESTIYLVQKGAYLFAMNDEKNLPLHLAATFGMIENLKYFILNLKMDPNSKGQWSQTTLHRSTEKNHIEIVKFLVEQTPVNIHAKDAYGRTALDIATINNFTEIIDYLRKKSNQIEFDFNQNQSNTARVDQSNIVRVDQSLPIAYSSKSKVIWPSISNQNANSFGDQQFYTNPSLQSLDLQSTMMLFNVLIRKLTNKKFITHDQELSLIDAKISALNIIDSFERILSKILNQFNIENFDSTKLISSLIWHLRNGKLNKIPNLLIDSLNKNEIELNSTIKNEIKIEIKKILIKEFESILSKENKSIISELLNQSKSNHNPNENLIETKMNRNNLFIN